jgi:hypothetical protein
MFAPGAQYRYSIRGGRQVYTVNKGWLAEDRRKLLAFVQKSAGLSERVLGSKEMKAAE